MRLEVSFAGKKKCVSSSLEKIQVGNIIMHIFFFGRFPPPEAKFTTNAR
jgi:hypothetical protein